MEKEKMTENSCKRHGVVYKLTSPSDQVYIGKTVNTEKRWKSYKKLKCQAQPKLYEALVQYGPESFKYEIIDEANTPEELAKKEKYHIKNHRAVETGYNCKTGQSSVKYMNKNQFIDGIEYVTAYDACEILDISPSTIKKMRYEGKIGFYRLNERCILYKLDDISFIQKSKHVFRKEEYKMNIVETNDGNIMFNGHMYIKELNVATRLRLTLEKLKRVPNIRSIVGPNGQKYYHKQDVDRLFVEGPRTNPKGKELLNE